MCKQRDNTGRRLDSSVFRTLQFEMRPRRRDFIAFPHKKPNYRAPSLKTPHPLPHPAVSAISLWALSVLSAKRALQPRILPAGNKRPCRVIVLRRSRVTGTPPDLSEDKESVSSSELERLSRMQGVSTEGASPGGRRLSRSFHSCLRGADHDDLESASSGAWGFSDVSPRAGPYLEPG
ncbi:hypothetical protein EAI_13042 [Harpegnathos saltator]|uniref:Uncharacterized protein n=1 Tax=Harpegnathos saltator TaxID=610380 RepID=E2B6A6_HARSA|nr:hypothetical protein EAI_13042 [Harpegnathos saltator]